MRLDLPVPPGVNGLYANATKGRVKSEAYRSWRHTAGWELKTQRPSHLDGHVAIEIFAGLPDRRRDLDGLHKALLDLLVVHHVIKDDHLVASIYARWDRTVPSGRVRLEVKQTIAPALRMSAEGRARCSEAARIRLAGA